MLNKIIGFFLLLASVVLYGYWYFTPDFAANWLFWTKVSVSGIAGIGTLLYELLKVIKIPVTRKKEKLTPSTLEQKDFEALTYLKKRMKSLNSNKGLDTIKELNAILFSEDLEYTETTSE